VVAAPGRKDRSTTTLPPKAIWTSVLIIVASIVIDICASSQIVPEHTEWTYDQTTHLWSGLYTPTQAPSWVSWAIFLSIVGAVIAVSIVMACGRKHKPQWGPTFRLPSPRAISIRKPPNRRQPKDNPYPFRPYPGRPFDLD
jgi:hypothetical protein